VAHPETQGLKSNSFEVDYVALKRHSPTGAQAFFHGALEKTKSGWGRPPHTCNPLLRHFGQLALLAPDV